MAENTFIDKDSGNEIFKERWYLISGSGSFYEENGFVTLIELRDWLKENANDYEIDFVCIPIYNKEAESWSCWEECNIVFGEDIFTYNQSVFD